MAFSKVMYPSNVVKTQQVDSLSFFCYYTLTVNKKDYKMSKLDRVLDELFWLAIYSIPAVFVVTCVSGIVYGVLFR